MLPENESKVHLHAITRWIGAYCRSESMLFIWRFYFRTPESLDRPDLYVSCS